MFTSLWSSICCFTNSFCGVSVISEYKLLPITDARPCLYSSWSHNTHTLTLSIKHTSTRRLRRWSVCSVTSLWMWAASRACWVSGVSGSWWYRDLLICCLLASLYFTWTHTHTSDQIVCDVSISTRVHVACSSIRRSGVQSLSLWTASLESLPSENKHWSSWASVLQSYTEPETHQHTFMSHHTRQHWPASHWQVFVLVLTL